MKPQLRTVLHSVLLLACAYTAPAQDTRRYAVQPVIGRQATAFALTDVRLLNGSPFKRAMDPEARTIDVVRLGEMQPEKDHNMQSNGSNTGETDGHKWRDARNGGWFSFELACDPNAPVALSSLYYGIDGGKRAFDVFVDGVKIASDSLTSEHPAQLIDGLFIEHVYPIPAALTAGKQRVTVWFGAAPGQSARGSFGVRMVRQGVGK